MWGVSVNQSSTQNQSANPNAYSNDLGQVSIQQGYGNSAAVGNDNAIFSNIEQKSVQNQQGSYGEDDNQLAVQNGNHNATAIGNGNRIINNSGQYNRQNKWSY